MWCMFNSDLTMYRPELIDLDTGTTIRTEYEEVNDTSNIQGYYNLVYNNPNLEEYIILKRIMDCGIEIEEPRDIFTDDILDLFDQIKAGKPINISN